MAPIKLIIDTDPGIDDAMAIMSAFNSPEVAVIGLTTIFGNVPTSMATRNALYLTHLAGHSEVPVVPGASFSLRGVEKGRVADFAHGTDGFGNSNIEHPENLAPSAEPAAQFICRMAQAHPGEVVLLALGPLTNLALALHLDPELPQRLARIVVLGGAFFVPGNVSPAAEANVSCDPDAAALVFARCPNLWAVGLDVTHQCMLPRGKFKELGGRHGKFLGKIAEFYLDYHKRYYSLDCCFVHDAAAFAAVVRPELFEWAQGAVVVAPDGPMRGHTLVDTSVKEWVGAHAWTGLPRVRVAKNVRAAEVIVFCLERMGA